MTKEAKELIAEFKKLEILCLGTGLDLAQESAIISLNNTIKALQKLNKRIGKLTPIALDIFEDEIENYQQLLNEIQNEQ